MTEKVIQNTILDSSKKRHKTKISSCCVTFQLITISRLRSLLSSFVSFSQTYEYLCNARLQLLTQSVQVVLACTSSSAWYWIWFCILELKSVLKFEFNSEAEVDDGAWTSVTCRGLHSHSAPSRKKVALHPTLFCTHLIPYKVLTSRTSPDWKIVLLDSDTFK